MNARMTLVLLLACCALAPLARPAAAQTNARCFAETGFCMSGRLREYWEQNGGLAVFGMPLTEQRKELSRETGVPYQTQWFERVRMELHPENQPPYDVLLGRIGEDRLRQDGRDWQTVPRETPNPRCRFFEQTGFNVCGQFLRDWRANGLEFDGRPGASEAESLALYGLPLGPVSVEMVEGNPYHVQWFERARFEVHLENQPPYDVLLGRLGAETRDAAEAQPGPRVLLIGDDYQLYRDTLLGGALTRLPITTPLQLPDPQATANVVGVAASPDGSRIAAIVAASAPSVPRQVTGLVVASRDGGGARLIPTGAVSLTGAPAWSPDGRQLAFAGITGERYKLFVIGADGGGLRQLTGGTSNDSAPQWAPDGRTIAFLSDPNAANAALSGSYLLTVVPASGGTPRGLASPVGEDFQWMPGGSELVLATSDGERSQIVALDAATGAQRVLVREDVNISGPSLSPDGTKLAYYRCCTAYNLPLAVRDLATGATTEVGRGLGAVRWSPDGRWLALLGDRRVDRVVMVRRADGTGAGATWSGRDPLWLP